MLDEIIYHLTLWKARWLSDADARSFAWRQLRTRDYNSIRDFQGEHMMEKSANEETIRALTTDYLIRQAERRFIALPDAEAFWEDATLSSRKILTVEGINHLRNAIRIEARARRESLNHWLLCFSVIGSVFFASLWIVRKK